VSIKNKKNELILLHARTQRNHFQNAVSGSLEWPNVKIIYSKKPTQVTALYKDLQKGIEGHVFGFVQGHISH